MFLAGIGHGHGARVNRSSGDGDEPGEYLLRQVSTRKLVQQGAQRPIEGFDSPARYSCNHLDDRSAGIMRARYGLEDGREHSLTEVASRFSLSRERIRQLEIQALGRLRELARAEGLQAA